MKQSHSIYYLLIGSLLLSSCVSNKKFSALQTEKQKLEQTLLETKNELSIAKRSLNKLEDSSSSSDQQKSSAINTLQQQLNESQSALNAAQAAVVACQDDLQKKQAIVEEQKVAMEQEYAPLIDLQKKFQHQHSALKAIYKDFNNLKTADSTLQFSMMLSKGELVLSLEQKNLFNSSGTLLSTKGRTELLTLATVIKKYPEIYITIQGHTATGGDEKSNWKTSTRKTLSIIYTLMGAEIPPKQMASVGYGQYKPIQSNDTPVGKLANQRTELILHYQNKALLKQVPIR